MCDVLDDMRKMHKTRNYSGLLGSIEQLQVMAYRMEAGLGDKRTIEDYDAEASRLERDLKRKRRELADLRHKIEEAKETLEDESPKRNGRRADKKCSHCGDMGCGGDCAK